MTRLSPTRAERKAAVLLAGLDAVAAERLLAELPPDVRQRLRQAVAELEGTDDAECGRVQLEFLLARRGPATAEATPPAETRLTEILSGLPDSVALTVRRRLDPVRPTTPAPRPESVPAAEMSVRIAAPRETSARSTPQRETAPPDSDIGRQTRAAAAPNTEEAPPVPATPRPRPQRLVDETLAAEGPDETLEAFDLDTLVQVLRQVDVTMAVQALAGSSRRLADRVLERLPSREAQVVIYELAHLGPVPPAVAEEAVRQVFRLVRRRLRQQDPAIRPPAAVEWSL